MPSVIYENGSLKRILVDGGYIEGNVYHFYLTDHLGNNRMVVKGDGTPVQTNHYYPFGMAFAETSTEELGKQPYRYNGKELEDKHGLNLYDYAARHMEPAMGRFTTVDPHAENYYSWSPYAYVGNNPLKYIDPTGMDWYQDEKGNTFWQEGSDKTVTRTYSGESGDMSITYKNIGTSYTSTSVDADGVSVNYTFEQNELASIYESPTLRASTREPSFFENWSSSANIFANISYNALNDLFVSLQPFTFGLIGETTNEFTGSIAHTNLDGTTNYKGIESFASTASWIVGGNEAKLGLSPLKTMNASQFSHTFKGTLSTFSPATRGTINRTMNSGIRTINHQIGSGNAVSVPVGVGSYYKSK